MSEEKPKPQELKFLFSSEDFNPREEWPNFRELCDLAEAFVEEGRKNQQHYGSQPLSGIPVVVLEPGAIHEENGKFYMSAETWEQVKERVTKMENASE